MNLYNTTEGKRTFGGVINPTSKENKISIFDSWNVDEMQQPTKPKGINNYLFKIMETATNEENSLFNTNF